MTDETEERDKFTGLPPEESVAQVLAVELVAMKLAPKLELTPLRLVSLMIVAYQQEEDSELRGLFEKGATVATSLSREYVEHLKTEEEKDGQEA